MSEAVSRRRMQTRAALIDGAMRVFASRGVAAASIEEICEASGFTRGAFYSNFASRDEIVLAIIERGIAEAQRHVTELVENRTDLHEAAELSRPQQEQLIRDIVTQFHAVQDNTTAWILAEREIELYTLRNPELRDRYEELTGTHFENMSRVVGTAIGCAGGKLTLPLAQFVDLLAAVSLAAGSAAVADRFRGLTSEDVVPDDAPLNIDPEPVVQLVLGLVDFSLAD
ncbi:TetR/AcrR family transcriptional regulator [Brevibacterium luteolum]|uniref:TetR/AcrR family transcriptional regulator n=1 Tax=Brevibacterium luteolum TaxID=199591 RepID=UPI0015849B2B|nr:TetR/AcrR family transcriptional regulator [Brevibacterium luteolum]MBU8578758.1 TetR family transcriptional regulator [Brevibacterium luteolum]NUL59356.1 TetR/AcrR family transcriptional regulator [Brevibacterium luteolum]